MTKFFAVTKDVLTIGLEFGHLVLTSELLTTGDDHFLSGRNCPITTGFALLETNFPFAKDPFSCSVPRGAPRVVVMTMNRGPSCNDPGVPPRHNIVYLTPKGSLTIP